MDGEMNQVFVGDGKIMGINDNLVYYRTGVNNEEMYGTNWNSTGWRATYLSISENVIVIIRDFKVLVRLGIDESNPLGTEWLDISGDKLIRQVILQLSTFFLAIIE